jgi:hypothetical protein
MRLKKEWNQIVTTYHRRRRELDVAKRVLSQAVQDESAALARAFGTTSTKSDDGRDRDVDKNEARQKQFAATREEAERKTSLAKEHLLKAILARDTFVAQAGMVYMDLAKRERRATAAALLMVAAAEKAHCQARIWAAEALEEAARAAGREEGVEEEVRAWAARHKQPELTHRYYAALRVLDQEWERQQHEKEQGEEIWEEGKGREDVNKERRAMDTFLADLWGPAATHRDEKEERATALDGRRDRVAAISSSSPSSLLPTSSSFPSLIDTPCGRAYFLRQLDTRRGGGTASTCLDPEIYDKVGACLTLVLNKCQAQKDVRAAQQVLLMANTFFRRFPSENSDSGGLISASITSVTSTAAVTSMFGVPVPSSSIRQPVNRPAQYQNPEEQPKREYLLACIRSHPWWQSREVWQEALRLNVNHELSQCPQRRPWESLSSEALRGQVLRVHNLTFGQLGSLALHMLECGVARDEMRAFVCEMCERTQLGEEQVQALMEAVVKVGGSAEEENEIR